MKKNLLLAAFLMGSVLTTQAQTTLFEDGFENYDDFLIEGFGNWLTLDVDASPIYSDELGNWENNGTPQAYIIFNPASAGVTNSAGGAETRNYNTHGGSKYAASWAAVMPGDGSDGGGAGPNNDWLVTPAVTLGNEGNTVSFWVKSLSDSYGLEEYEVGIFNGTGTPTETDFTIIQTTQTAPYGEWEEVVISLDETYNSDTVRIGIHNVGADHYMFMVDDISITTTGTASVKDVLASQLSVSPNPSNNIINITNTSNIVVNGASIADLNGRVVKTVKFGGADAQVNISDLASGVYMMTITSDKGTTTKKVIKN